MRSTIYRQDGGIPRPLNRNRYLLSGRYYLYSTVHVHYTCAKQHQQLHNAATDTTSRPLFRGTAEHMLYSINRGKPDSTGKGILLLLGAASYCCCCCLSHLPGTTKPFALLAVEPSAPVCLGLRRGQGALIHATVGRESVYLHSATRQKTGRARERENPRNINTEATAYVTDGEVRDIARSGRCGASPVLFTTARLGGGGCAEWAEGRCDRERIRYVQPANF